MRRGTSTETERSRCPPPGCSTTAPISWSRTRSGRPPPTGRPRHRRRTDDSYRFNINIKKTTKNILYIPRKGDFFGLVVGRYDFNHDEHVRHWTAMLPNSRNPHQERWPLYQCLKLCCNDRMNARLLRPKETRCKSRNMRVFHVQSIPPISQEWSSLTCTPFSTLFFSLHYWNGNVSCVTMESEATRGKCKCYNWIHCRVNKVELDEGSLSLWNYYFVEVWISW